MYRLECLELFGIDLTRPRGFKVINGVTIFRVNEKINTGTIYRMTLESRDKDCLILFPIFDITMLHNIKTQNMVYAELKAALDLDSSTDMGLKMINEKFMIQRTLNSNPENVTIEFDSVKYVKMITKDNMGNYFNADSVFIWKVPILQNWYSANLPKYYKEKYNECIGVNVIKKGHPSAMIKILLTEEGKKKEKEYMKVLFKSIHYSDTVLDYKKNKREAYKKLKFRSIFHRKKYDTIIDYTDMKLE